MELFFLLCSILSSSVTTITLSLLLPFRHLLRRFCSPVTTTTTTTHYYQGTVYHERRRPVHHSFKYSVRYALFDLDHKPSDAPSDHLSADRARQFSKTNGPIFLLTIPPSVGYEQNPLSIYYCYDVEGSGKILKNCIAEVTNTPWGERVLFLFDPNSDTIAKPLHVSPFMDMLGSWKIKANIPGDNLFVAIVVQHPKLGDYFTASLTANRVPSFVAGDPALFFWLMPHKVALWIYWHALKLWWKNVPFIQHPRYHNSAYRQEAILNDQKLWCCQSLRRNTQDDIQLESSGFDRCFTWRDAKWPWC